MKLKVLLASAIFSISTIASAAQVAIYPLASKVALTYDASKNTIFASGRLLSGMNLTNSLNTASINKTDEQAKLQVSEGFVTLTLQDGRSLVIGKVLENGSLEISVPVQGLQVSERYDAIEKSFGQVDVDYITVDVTL